MPFMITIFRDFRATIVTKKNLFQTALEFPNWKYDEI